MENKPAIRQCNRTATDFPARLSLLADIPSSLYYRGIIPDSRPALAIVGTRAASPAGRDLAFAFARDLAQAGFAIVSGLALGIDTRAHQGALAAGGITWAVVANGLDHIYPAQNEALAHSILNTGGALISEYPKGTPSYPNHFIERNRIISGLADAVLVIEAPPRSGALATARFAREQNRPVFVIPGPASSSHYAGSHNLIRSGARLVTTPAHLLEDMAYEPDPEAPHQTSLLDPQTPPQKIVAALANASTPLSLDRIAELTTLSPQDVSTYLNPLLLAGDITETYNGRYTLHR